VQPLRFTPLSTPEAVLLYAPDFLPSWAGAISIDLMPAVLILILAGVHSAIRREEGAELDAHHVTVAEMTQALRLYNAMQEAQAEAQTIQQPSPSKPEGAPQAPQQPEPQVAKTEPQEDARNQPGVTPLPTPLPTVNR
jgi:hypothetical protein